MLREIVEGNLSYLEFIADNRTYDLRAGLASMYTNDMAGFKRHLKREYKEYSSSPKAYMKNLTKYSKGK